jgi:hypothetical protein
MEDFNITDNTSYNVARNEFFISVNDEFEDKMWRSCYGSYTNFNWYAPAQNTWSPTKNEFSMNVDKQQEILVGELNFERPNSCYFEYSDSLKNLGDLAFQENSASLNQIVDPSTNQEALNKFKKSKYTSRVDVVNKSILRMIKFYYLQLLYKHFPKYKSKRICRVNKLQLVGDINSILTNFDNNCVSYKKLGEYVFWALRPNDALFVTKDKIILDEVKAYFDCIAKYSYKKLKEMHSSTFGKSIFEFIFLKDKTFKNLLESQKLVNKNKDAYEDGFKRFVKGFGISDS